MVRRVARFHTNQARCKGPEERDHLPATRLPRNDNLALFVDPVNLEDILVDVEAILTILKRI
jgi:hypothetical protein